MAKKKKKIQWHPFLVQFLRRKYKGKFTIKEAFKLGKMPLEMDMWIQLEVPPQSLPYPFNYLAKITLVEFKGPGDTAGWKAVSQIEGYACLYQQNEKIKDRREITLWIIASEFAANFNKSPCDYIDDLTEIGEGVSKGELTRFPIYLIDLSKLPISVSTIPLLMVYRGDLEREKEIVRFVIKHRAELREYFDFLSTLHIKAYKEVLSKMTIEDIQELDLDWDEIYDHFLNFVIPFTKYDKDLEAVVLDKIIQSAGTEKVEKFLEKAKKAKTA